MKTNEEDTQIYIQDVWGNVYDFKKIGENKFTFVNKKGDDMMRGNVTVDKLFGLISRGFKEAARFTFIMSNRNFAKKLSNMISTYVETLKKVM